VKSKTKNMIEKQWAQCKPKFLHFKTDFKFYVNLFVFHFLAANVNVII